MFANAHGMNRAASVPNDMRNDKAKQRASRVEKQCRAWMHWRIPGVWEIRYARAGVRNVG